MRTLDVWYDRTTAEDLVAHFPKRYRAQAQRDVTRALRKDHLRAVARLTDRSPTAGPAFVEDPPLVVHLDDDRPRPRRGRRDGRRLPRRRSPTTAASSSTASGWSTSPAGWSGSAASAPGVGSCLFEASGRAGGGPDRIVLQVKEAQPSVLAPYVGRVDVRSRGPSGRGRPAAHPGRQRHLPRVVRGARSGRQYYVRQLWDVKGQGDLTRMDLGKLTHYGALCARALARAHARTGDAATHRRLPRERRRRSTGPIAGFAAKYAANNERDHAALVDAIAGRAGAGAEVAS